jgi:two-component sensor histidine kinase
MVIAMAPAATAILAGVLGIVMYDRMTVKSALVHQMQVLAQTVGSNCRAALAFTDSDAATETLAALRAEPKVKSGVIYASDGTMFAHFSQYGEAAISPDRVMRHSGHHFHADRLYLFEPIVLDGEQVGVIGLNVDLAEIDARTLRMVGLSLLALMITSVFVYLVVNRLQRYVTTPLLGLSETAKRVAETDDYSIRAMHRSEDELGFLVSTFNDMLARIETQNDELHTHQLDLEQRVRERTTDLEQEMLERQSAEQKIRQSLEEKEVLLKEIHHRVKNNMQVITSLLHLQLRHIQEPVMQAMYQDTINRVKSMALIHEKLYRSDDVAHINFSEYSRSLALDLRSSLAMDTRRISLELDVDEILLDVDHAVPCGLIINELVANALKHAFPGNRTGTVLVSFKQLGDGNLLLSVGDDGMGVGSDVDLTRSASLGLRLVNSLTRQLGGDLEWSTETGTHITIRFRVAARQAAQGVV